MNRTPYPILPPSYHSRGIKGWDWKIQQNEPFQIYRFVCRNWWYAYPFERLGGTCVFSSEWDAHAQQTYHHNFGEMPVGDITKIDETEIPDHDILLAGFPCQPFSIIGDKHGFEDTRGTLFFDIARI